ncbi:MAG: hypothetical protein ACI8Y6_000012 [Brevundimonas sp.]|jgi:hypothetical protein
MDAVVAMLDRDEQLLPLSRLLEEFDLQGDLRQTLDLCVSALTGRRAIGIEISGGLDSAIVGGALKALRRPVAFALNTRGPHAETDERRYAQDVAEAVGAGLTCLARGPVAYSAELFEATAGDPWPSQNGRDLGNDLLVAAACRQSAVKTASASLIPTKSNSPWIRRTGEMIRSA